MLEIQFSKLNKFNYKKNVKDQLGQNNIKEVNQLGKILNKNYKMNKIITNIKEHK